MWEQKAKKAHQGFTIVELLIVIVVIAILAVISIVAYNGIQARAENTKTFSAVAGYVKTIAMYAAETGLYPIPASNYPCLGSVSYCGNVTDTGAGCDSTGRATGSTSAFKTMLLPYATSLPEPSSQSMNCGGKTYSGAWYVYSLAGKGAEVRAYLKGAITCQPIGGASLAVTYQADDTTRCKYDFPVLP